MARVTVEDCVLQIPNRFELVMLAAHRARGLASGAELQVDRDRDKNPVVALREIAEQKLDLDSLNESLIKGMQKRIEPDQPEEEVVDLMAGEQQSWIQAGLQTSDEESDDDVFTAEDEGEEGDSGLETDDGLDADVSFEDMDVKD